MKTQPYEKYSIRSPRLWKKAADAFGVHPVLLRKVYLDRWCTGVDARDFIDLVCGDRNDRDAQKVRATITKELAEVQMTDAEVEAKAKRNQELAEENDITDMLDYRLKQLIEVGDEVVSEEDKTFCFSGKQYQTAGKRYRITELSDTRDGLTGFTAITTSDIKGERIWWSVHGVRSLWRDGKEIWNWNLAYYALYAEQNPDNPDLAELKAHCEKNGALMSCGKRAQYT